MQRKINLGNKKQAERTGKPVVVAEVTKLVTHSPLCYLIIHSRNYDSTIMLDDYIFLTKIIEKEWTHVRTFKVVENQEKKGKC